MTAEYYGASRDAQIEINHLLGLPAQGGEQDWEIEFADPSKIRSMLDALEQDGLGVDAKSALCLLIISSLEEARSLGSDDEGLLQRASRLIKLDPVVLERMTFYWVDLGRAEHLELAAKLFPK
jgi:hypothetical protein